MKNVFKKTITIILSIGLILSSILGVNFEVKNVYGTTLPGVHHAVVGNDVFLGGNFMEIGVNKHGSLGSASDAPAGFHPSSRTTLGMVVDGDGFGVGNAPTTGDFFLPGAPYESYVVDYKNVSGTPTKSQVAEPSGMLGITNISTTDTSSGDTLSATTVGTTNDGKLQITQVVSFDVNSEYFNIHVTYNNISEETLYDARYLRSVDCDQDADLHGSYATKNSVTKNPPQDGMAIVIAKGGFTNDPFMYISSDPRARAAITNMTDPYNAACYNADGSVLLAAETTNDVWIAITYDLGDIAPGQSVSLDLKNSLNPDITAALEATTGAAITVTTTSAIQDISVSNGTTQGAIGLPHNMNIGLSNSTTTSAAITWDNGTPTYNGTVAGTYAFVGTFTLPEGVTNPDNKTANVNVIVGARTTSSSSGGSSGGVVATAPAATVNGNVVDNKTGQSVAAIPAQVTTATDGTKTVTMKSSDAVVVQQADGTKSALTDLSKIGFSAPITTTANGISQAVSVTIASDGTIQVKGLANNTATAFDITYDLGNGQKITMGSMTVKVDSNGNVSLTSSLIDPYGIITDAATGKIISGANVTLYYANTARNIANGKTPDTLVSLPGIDGFKPNNNANPQVSDALGEYGFMVFPTSDYYIVSTMDGYNKYTSRAIPVEQEIVTWNFKMNPINITTGVKRLSGSSRVDTSIEVAKATYSNNISNVILVTSENYPDALAGSILSYKLNAPILLLGNSDEDQKKVLDYMKSNMDTKGTVYILGGIGVVNKDIEAAVTASGFSNINRIAGADRYETSAAITDVMKITVDTPIVLVSGEDYPDALSISSAAAVNQYPILLVNKNGIPDSVQKEISLIKPNKIYIIGLQGAISTSVDDQAAKLAGIDKTNIVRIGGTNRFETSIEVAKYFNLSGNVACIATGNDFPDALAGSLYSANNNSPIILADKKLSADAITYLQNQKMLRATIFGGEGAVNKDIQQQLSELVGK